MFARLSSRLALVAVLVVGLGTGNAVLTLGTPVPQTTMMQDMTWMEVMSAIQHGSTTVIVPTGGVEQNGPHMILNKHDHIVGHAARVIAGNLGRTLVAPVVSFVPQGDYAPPTDNMQLPGTIGLREPVFEQLLDGIARSLKAAGFRTILFIGDHGPSQATQARVAAALSREWAGDGVLVAQIERYYEDDAQNKLLVAQGESAATIGFHAGLIDTSELMAVHPSGVMLDRLQGLPGSLRQMGASGDPSRASPARGAALLAIRIDAATAQIRAILAGR